MNWFHTSFHVFMTPNNVIKDSYYFGKKVCKAFEHCLIDFVFLLSLFTLKHFDKQSIKRILKNCVPNTYLCLKNGWQKSLFLYFYSSVVYLVPFVIFSYYPLYLSEAHYWNIGTTNKISSYVLTLSHSLNVTSLKKNAHRTTKRSNEKKMSIIRYNQIQIKYFILCFRSLFTKH